LMKMIDFNNWTRLNNLGTPVPKPITDLPVNLHGLLSQLYFVYSLGRLAWFYYRLRELVLYSFLNGGDDYFNEDD
jgi:hypothetical protein